MAKSRSAHLLMTVAFFMWPPANLALLAMPLSFCCQSKWESPQTTLLPFRASIPDRLKTWFEWTRVTVLGRSRSYLCWFEGSPVHSYSYPKRFWLVWCYRTCIRLSILMQSFWCFQRFSPSLWNLREPGCCPLLHQLVRLGWRLELQCYPISQKTCECLCCGGMACCTDSSLGEETLNKEHCILHSTIGMIYCLKNLVPFIRPPVEEQLWQEKQNTLWISSWLQTSHQGHEWLWSLPQGCFDIQCPELQTRQVSFQSSGHNKSSCWQAFEALEVLGLPMMWSGVCTSMDPRTGRGVLDTSDPGDHGMFPAPKLLPTMHGCDILGQWPSRDALSCWLLDL